jgi:ABC-type Fe3+-hydroxamate transport system substrate-binding protein
MLVLGLAAPLAAALRVSPAQAAPLTITDAIGRTITLKAPAERIALGFNYEEFTAIAGPTGWDRVVGFERTLWTEWRPSTFKRYLVPIPAWRTCLMWEAPKTTPSALRRRQWIR